MGSKALVVGLFFAVVFAESRALALRSIDMKQSCVNCHTMHNSQGGNADFSGVGVQGALLNNTCYGCHTGDNAGHDGAPRTPKVLHFSPNNPPLAPYMTTGTEAGHNTLAGGDFGWVSSNGLKGHNVNIPGISQAPRYPPGNNTKLFDADNPLTCAGVNGCHGDLARTGEISAMYQTHHAVEQAQPMDGSTLTKSYRWLNGVAGYEDPDYELTVTSAAHNQYMGIARTAESGVVTSSISNFCAGCHGDFHSGAGSLGIWDGATTFGADPWIRHPVDYEMGLTVGTEYAEYGGAGNEYQIKTPVGSDIVLNPGVKSAVTGVRDTIIVCVSCHRAHGSPYDYSLRWDYKNWPGGANAYNGCGDCHTVKN